MPIRLLLLKEHPQTRLQRLVGAVVTLMGHLIMAEVKKEDPAYGPHCFYLPVIAH